MLYKTIQDILVFLTTNSENMPAEKMLGVAIGYALPVPAMSAREDYYGVYNSLHSVKVATALCEVNEERLIDIEPIREIASEVWNYRCASLWEFQFDVPDVFAKMTVEDWVQIRNLVEDIRIELS